MLQLNKSKAFLERFHDLVNKKHTGTNVFDELQELSGLVQGALDEVYQAELDASPQMRHLKRLQAHGAMRVRREIS